MPAYKEVLFQLQLHLPEDSLSLSGGLFRFTHDGCTAADGVR